MRHPRPWLAFGAMAATYSIGVLDDNFYKQSSMLLAVGEGHTSLQGMLAIAFILPYLLASAPAGWAADRFPKRQVIIAAKLIELIAVALGALAIVFSSWPLVLVMAFIMGLQSAVFSPAMNGALPELFKDAELTRANAVLKTMMVAAVLLGIALAGVVLGHGGRVAVAGTIGTLGVLGFVCSLGAPRGEAAAPDAPFPKSGPIQSLHNVRSATRDRALTLAIVMGSLVWCLGSLEAMLVNPLGKVQLGFSDSTTSALLAAQMIGIGVGGAMAGTLASGRSWHHGMVARLLVVAVALMGMLALPWVPSAARFAVAAVLLTVGGAAGGLVLIPCEAFLQARPSQDKRGEVLGAYGFVFGCGIIVSGLVGNVLNATCPPTVGFGIVGLATALVALAVHRQCASLDEHATADAEARSSGTGYETLPRRKTS